MVNPKIMYIRTRMKRINPKSIFTTVFIQDCIKGMHKIDGVSISNIFKGILMLEPDRFISDTKKLDQKTPTCKLAKDLSDYDKFLYNIDFKKAKYIGFDEDYQEFSTGHHETIYELTSNYLETKSKNNAKLILQIFNRSLKNFKLESKLVDDIFSSKEILYNFIKKNPDYQIINHIRNAITHEGEGNSYAKYDELKELFEFKDMKWNESVKYDKMEKITGYLLGISIMTYIFTLLIHLELFPIKLRNEKLLKIY